MNREMFGKIIERYFEKERDTSGEWEYMLGTLYVESDDEHIGGVLTDEERMEREKQAGRMAVLFEGPFFSNANRLTRNMITSLMNASDVFKRTSGMSCNERMHEEAKDTSVLFDTLETFRDIKSAQDAILYLSSSEEFGTLGELHSCYLLVIQWKRTDVTNLRVSAINIGVHIQDSLVGTKGRGE